MKCLEYRSSLAEEEACDESAQSAKNDKSDGELHEVWHGNGKLNNKGSGTVNSDESEQDNVLCDESTSRISSTDKDVKEGKQKKNADLKMLTRSMNSVLAYSITQPCTPQGSKKIPAQNVENNFNLSSSKYALCLFTCWFF
jgi:hypothetical protein